MSDRKVPEIVVLHRHWMWANLFRTRFDAHLSNHTGSPPEDPTFTEDWVINLCSWYGHLYVTIEGWQAIGLSDGVVDDLLNSPNVDLLRRLRNAIWHYQDSTIDPRITEFMAALDAVSWVRSLNQNFGRVFLQWFGKR